VPINADVEIDMAGRDEFLATLSHELRTPLNAILGWVQVLQMGGLSSERTAQAIDVIGRNAHLQALLIEDMLDVSRIIAGNLEVERLPVSVTALVDLVAADLSPVADAKGITVTKVGPRSLPLIEGDPKRLGQVLGNVVSNAIKFTNDGGHVVIRSALVGSAIEVQVQDSGVGMAPEFMLHAFDRFRQGESGPARQHGGLGLGLAISRHLLELHHGTITADSAGLNRGTTITMRLPVGDVIAPPIADPVAP
jgi:signal transduction histidine kinase